MPKDRRASHLSSPLGIAGGTLSPGVRVGGAGYVLKKMVGRGGISEVWVAWARKLEKDVALKFLPLSLLKDANLLELVRSEVERGQKLEHPSIVRIYDFVRDYDSVAVAMEYVQGWSLAALKVDRPQKRYRVEELGHWIRPLCEALEYAHHQVCLVHRDLKPCNILLNAREHIKITDFGMAHAIRSALAQQGQLVYGAIAYMSPQQVKGAEASLLDDVYSLGATIFDLLTGTPPFYAGEIMAQVFGMQPPSMTERLAQLEIEDSIPKLWDEAVAAALEKDPARRPQSASEFLQWLESPPKRVPPPAGPVASVGKKAVENPPAAGPALVEPTAAAPTSSEPAALEPAPPEPTAPKPAEIVAASPESPGPAPAETLSAATESAAGSAGVPGSIGQEVSVQEGTADPVTPAEPVAELAPSEGNALVARVASWVRVHAATQRRSLLLLGAIVLALLIVAGGVWSALRLRHQGADKMELQIARMTGPPGSLDSSFRAGAGADNEIRSLKIQPDGRILVAGKFATFDGAPAQGIARLDAQGSLDTNFTAQVSGTVHSIAVQPDGKVLLGGDFMKVNGQPRKRIARLAADGSLDSSFNAKGALNKEVRALLIQPDGKILAGGSFDATSGNHQNRITRFNPDGTRDGTFAPGAAANGTVFALALQPDGKILVAGHFTRFDDSRCGHIVRLNQDGSPDSSFDCGSGANATVLAALVLSDGKILIAGAFTSVGGIECSRLARLNANGGLDPGFHAGIIAKADVRSVAIQSGGKLLVGGSFNSVQGMTRNGIARLNVDGSLDQRFDPGQGTTDGSVWSVSLTKDGKVLVAGVFSDFNGTPCGRIARLNGDGARSAK